MLFTQTLYQFSVLTQIQTQLLIYTYIIFDSPNFQRELIFNAYLDKKICQWNVFLIPTPLYGNLEDC